MPYYRKPENLQQFYDNIAFQFDGLKGYIENGLVEEARIKANVLAQDVTTFVAACEMLQEQTNKKKEGE